MDYIKDFINAMLGSFKKDNLRQDKTTEPSNPFQKKQLLGVPESSIINPIKIQQQKKKFFYLTIIVIVIALIIGLIAFFGVRGNYCTNIEKITKEIVLNYAEKEALLPMIEGEHIIIDLSQIDDPIMFNDKECGGTVKITKYQDKYIPTIDLTDCNYCTTSKRYPKWSNETDKYNDKEVIVDVIPYYNYYTVENSNTAWTGWTPEEEINPKEDEKYKVKLPKNLNILPKLNDNVEIVKYDVETKNYYSYRDKMWKFYRYNINTYSDFSSTAPTGYPKKDTSTLIITEQTEWSPNYPDTYEYRNIYTKTGYRWYYEENNEKKYWNNGEYTPDSPGEKYRKDLSDSINVYSYVDSKWRWSYGEQLRGYGSYRSTPDNYYKYKDEGLTIYSNWSNFSDRSYRNTSNASYREEKTNIHYRYRINYNIISKAIFGNTPVTKEDLLKKLNLSIEEIIKDPTIKLEVTYKFKYKK
ncbi:MAG: hypothetical protein PHO63_00315 [Bacilli bacterium]|nr:hypothetical protein [Bacilli bacterium]MDD4808686.1 hypothetical protein [Bacilli bacterium]